MRTERILVTGGTGFTGSHLCRRLIQKGFLVRAIVRNPEKAKFLKDLGVEIFPGDIVEYKSVLKSTINVDKVYHLAALYRREGVPRKAFWDVHVTGTKNLLKASIINGIQRFIHCSTVGVHGNIINPPADEEAPFSPGDLYQETKLEGEKLVQEIMAKGKLPCVVFRPSGIYGPGDMRFLKLFKALARKRFVMIGKGEHYYHMTYIDDLIDGILLCGTRSEAIGEIFILAGSEYTTLKEVILTICKVLNTPIPKFYIPVKPVYWASWLCEKIFTPLGIEPPIYRRRVDFFIKNRAFDISKGRRLLGYNPKINLEEGIQKTAEWYRSNNLI